MAVCQFQESLRAERRRHEEEEEALLSGFQVCTFPLCVGISMLVDTQRVVGEPLLCVFMCVLQFLKEIKGKSTEKISAEHRDRLRAILLESRNELRALFNKKQEFCA